MYHLQIYPSYAAQIHTHQFSPFLHQNCDLYPMDIPLVTTQIFFSCCGNTDVLKPISVHSVDCQLFGKKVVCRSRYFDWYKHRTRMDFTKTLPSDYKARSIIRFLTVENKSGAEIHCRLCVMYGEEHVMNVRNVQWWQKMFKEKLT